MLKKQGFTQGTPEPGGAGGTVTELRAMGTYKKQKKCYQLFLLLFSNNVDRKKLQKK